MGTNSEQRKELESVERRSRRIKAMSAEWINLIDQTRETMPDCSEPDFEKTMRMPFKGAKRSHYS